MRIEADWMEVWTPAEAEAQLEGFKFNGAGLYTVGFDTILVVPCWVAGAKELQEIGNKLFWERKADTYLFYVYNRELHNTIWNFVSDIPVRQRD